MLEKVLVISFIGNYGADLSLFLARYRIRNLYKTELFNFKFTLGHLRKRKQIYKLFELIILA